MSEGLPAWFSGDLRIITVVLDGAGRINYFGPDAENLTGYRGDEMLGRDIQILLNTTLTTEARREMARTASTHAEVFQVRKSDGQLRAVHVYRHPIPQPGGPPAVLLLGVDAVEANRGEASLGLLQAFFRQSSIGFAILDTSLRFVALNEALAKFNARPLGDHLGRKFRDVVASADIDAYESILRGLLSTGEPLWNLEATWHPTAAPGSERVWSASWYRLTRWDDQPIGLCGVIAEVKSDTKAILDASRNRSRLALLSRIGAAEVSTLDMRESSQRLTEVLTEDYCDLAVIDLVHDVMLGEAPPEYPTADTLVSRIGVAVREPSPLTDRLVEEAAPRLAGESEPFAHVLATNRPQLFQNPDPAQALVMQREPERYRAAIELGIGSAIILPLRARDSTLGAMTCVRFQGREAFDQEDMMLAGEIADRTALSLDNSRLYRDEKQAALTLQLSLLPHELPEPKEVELTYRYHPNRSTLRAGGDWFDVVQLPGRRVGMVVGDVAGHGIDAAAAMGQYRTAVRTLASLGLEPAVLLTRLNELSFDFGDDITATCVFTLYDPTQDWCAIASAGHPPPLLATPGGNAAPQEIAGGPLLGAVPHARYHASTLATPPGTRLLMYSDGVVESRTTRIDDGIASLVRQMRAGRAPGEVCDAIMTTAPDNRDDRTVLLASFRGALS